MNISENRCAICWDDFKNYKGLYFEGHRKNDITHLFDSSCFREWTKDPSHKFCPLCVQPLKEEELVKFENPNASWTSKKIEWLKNSVNSYFPSQEKIIFSSLIGIGVSCMVGSIRMDELLEMFLFSSHLGNVGNTVCKILIENPERSKRAMTTCTIASAILLGLSTYTKGEYSGLVGTLAGSAISYLYLSKLNVIASSILTMAPIVAIKTGLLDTQSFRCKVSSIMFKRAAQSLENLGI